MAASFGAGKDLKFCACADDRHGPLVELSDLPLLHNATELYRRTIPAKLKLTTQQM